METKIYNELPEGWKIEECEGPDGYKFIKHENEHGFLRVHKYSGNPKYEALWLGLSAARDYALTNIYDNSISVFHNAAELSIDICKELQKTDEFCKVIEKLTTLKDLAVGDKLEELIGKLYELTTEIMKDIEEMPNEQRRK